MKQIPTGPWRENCYVVTNLQNEVLIIDPGGEYQQIVNYIESRHLKLLAILGTHAHYDHIGEVSALKEYFSVPYYLHSKDKKLLRRANLYCKVFEGERPISIPTVDRYLDEMGNTLSLGSFSIDVLWTPGHTPGGVFFYCEDCLFVGDMLGHHKIGRSDLPGGDQKALHSSLKQLGNFPRETIIHPGHGSACSIRDELENNPTLFEIINEG